MVYRIIHKEGIFDNYLVVEFSQYEYIPNWKELKRFKLLGGEWDFRVTAQQAQEYIDMFKKYKIGVPQSG